MRILFLGYIECRILDYLRERYDVFQTSKRIKNKFVDDFDYVVSFGYRYILPKEVLSRVRNEIINMHISYLPYNRGADPNFWSFYDDTPKGVSIHFVDDGIDTGDILFQKEIIFNEDEDDLEKTYNTLKTEIQNLFIEKWDSILEGDFTRLKQTGIGSMHTVEEFIFDLPHKWKTKTQEIERLKNSSFS